MRLWGAIVLLLSGVAMAIVTGCFLIGVMLSHSPNITANLTFLIKVLYVLAFLSAIASAILLCLGVRKMSRFL